MTVQVMNEVVTLQHSSSCNQRTTEEQEDDIYLRLRKQACEDDDDYTTSTASLLSKDSDDDSVASASSTVATANRVSFCDELITMEWTRPYTEPEDIPLLYYSTEQINRFRHDYRLERSVNIGDDSLINVEGDPADGTNRSANTSRRAISRVVVLHEDKIASFTSASFTDNFDVPEDFFDTPEFWSGSITWW